MSIFNGNTKVAGAFVGDIPTVTMAANHLSANLAQGGGVSCWYTNFPANTQENLNDNFEFITQDYDGTTVYFRFKTVKVNDSDIEDTVEQLF